MREFTHRSLASRHTVHRLPQLQIVRYACFGAKWFCGVFSSFLLFDVKVFSIFLWFRGVLLFYAAIGAAGNHVHTLLFQKLIMTHIKFEQNALFDSTKSKKNALYDKVQRQRHLPSTQSQFLHPPPSSLCNPEGSFGSWNWGPEITISGEMAIPLFGCLVWVEIAFPIPGPRELGGFDFLIHFPSKRWESNPFPIPSSMKRQ